MFTRNPIRRLSLGAALLAAVWALLVPTLGAASVGDREVTIDFSTYGSDRVFDPEYYGADGIRFPSETCGSAGCAASYIGFIQGDAALSQTPLLGPIQATFTRPVSDLSLRVAPSIQGTATYVLKAFAASGEVVGETSVTVTQDFGDPANTGFGYFTLSLRDLPRPAKSFTVDSVFVRSSFGLTAISYGVSSITYAHWGG